MGCRKQESRRKCRKAQLVDQIFHERGGRKHAAHVGSEARSIAREREQVVVALVERDRRLGLPARPAHDLGDRAVGLVDPARRAHHLRAVARVGERRARP